MLLPPPSEFYLKNYSLGQIINVIGNISLKFNCEFYYSGISNYVSCKLTHNSKTLRLRIGFRTFSLHKKSPRCGLFLTAK